MTLDQPASATVDTRVRKRSHVALSLPLRRERRVLSVGAVSLGSVVEHKAGMTIEPCPRLGMLMRSVIVEDHMNDPADRDLGLDRVQEPDEFLVPVALHAATNDLAVEHVEGGEQGCGAVSLIVMRH